jgi:4-hydroxy-4-methyl-2-oxoglutarate aldolase
MNNSALGLRLAALDSCAVSDATDRLGLVGAVTGLHRLATQKRIAGKVITVKLAAGGAPGTSKRHLCTGAIEAADTGDIIVVQQSTGINAAGWGGVLSNAATQRGLSGVIVEGPARDIDEADELGFPVFARQGTCLTARGRVHEESFGEPISVGGVVVGSGDYVIADASGTVFIPALRVAEVVSVAESIVARERLMTSAVRSGERISVVMGADYEKMLESAK